MEKNQDIQRLQNRKRLLSEQKRVLKGKNSRLETRIENLSEQILKAREANVELAQGVEEEILKQRVFRSQVHSMEKELRELQENYDIQRAEFARKSQETNVLERELEKLLSKKEAYLKYSKRASGASIALAQREGALKKKIGQEDQELKSFESGHVSKTKVTSVTPSHKQFRPGDALKKQIWEHAGRDIKPATALYNCLRVLIEKIEENEFEGVSYKTRVNKNQKVMGARVFFENLNSQYADFCENLSPAVLSLGKRFTSHGLDIQTKARRNSAGVVTAVDLIVLVSLKASKQKSPGRFRQNKLKTLT